MVISQLSSKIDRFFKDDHGDIRLFQLIILGILFILLGSHPNIGLYPLQYASLTATGFIALATVLSAYISLQNVKASRERRNAEFLPLFDVQTEGYALGKLPALKVKNIGNGPAKDVKTKIGLKPYGPQESYTTQHLSEDDSMIITLFDEHNLSGSSTEEKLRNLLDEYTVLSIKVDCQDALGNKKSYKEFYNLQELLHPDPAKIMINERSPYDRIVEELEQLRTEVSNLQD